MPLRTSARSGARVSLVTRPFQASSHSALLRSASDGRADAVGELAEEPRPARVERVEDGSLEAVGLVALDLGQGQVGLVGEVEADPAVAAGQRGVTGPDDLAGRGELVEHRRLVVAHAGGEHQRLEGARRHRAAGELVDGGDHAVDAAQGAADALPGGEEAGDRRRG